MCDARAAGTRLAEPRTSWDASRTYRQLVILVAFNDQDFSMDNPNEYYNNLFNQKDYNEREANGCVADYFRDQSNGMFNPQFDIIGPVYVDQSAKTKYNNDGHDAYVEASKKVVDSLKVDFSPYDWDGDKYVDQVIFISAGYCANTPSGVTNMEGWLWPNTGYLYPTVKSSDGYTIRVASCCAEKWYNEISCGLGTICHEYSHCFGLPDLYPTDRSSFSVVDEWDLMDGGNYTCWGWSPPNYSAEEKYRLGWLTPEEVSVSTKVRSLKPSAKGGKVYRSQITADEYYLLENRQQTGWDRGLPGKGLLVTYTNFSSYVWRGNSVNGSAGNRYDIIHADGMTYDDWNNYILTTGMTEYEDVDNRFRQHHLMTAAYPLKNETVDVHECSLAPYSFTNITMDAQGLISFDVVAGETAIRDASLEPAAVPDAWYNLRGQRLPVKPQSPGLYIIRYTNGKTKKILL